MDLYLLQQKTCALLERKATFELEIYSEYALLKCQAGMEI